MTGEGEGRPSVLLVRLSALGDVILTLPALAALRAAHPRARIGWVVEDRCAELLRDHPQIDELIVMPRRAWKALRAERGRLAALGAMRAFRRDLRARRFDVALDLQGNLKSAFVARASGAPRRIAFGRRDTREPAHLLATETVDLGGATLHRTARDRALIAALGVAAPEAAVPALHGPADDAAVDALLTGAAGGGPLVVVHPGTSAWFAPKRWPAGRWAALVDRLVARQDARVVLSAGPEDAAVLEAMRAAMTSRPLIPARPLGLRELAALFARADLAIGADTGPLHLAGVLGAPTVILFGPYDPRGLHPPGHPERAPYAAVPCSPCRYRDCPRPVCMTALDADAVAATAEAVLAGQAPPAWPTAPRRTVIAR